MFNVQCLTDFSAINILDSDLWIMNGRNYDLNINDHNNFKALDNQVKHDWQGNS